MDRTSSMVYSQDPAQYGVFGERSSSSSSSSGMPSSDSSSDDEFPEDIRENLLREIVIGDIEFQPRTPSGFDWSGNLRNHGKLALDLSDYLFNEMQTDGLMGYQEDIFRMLIKYGINSVQCLRPLALKEIWCMWDIESDQGNGSGDVEDILINILQNGVLTENPGFVTNSPRTYQGEYIYVTLLNMLNDNKDHVIQKLSEIKDRSFISIWKGSGSRIYIENALAMQKDDMEWAYEVRHIPTALNMVEQGLGITLAPKLAISKDYSSLSYRPLIDPAVTRTIGLIKRSGRELSYDAKKLYELLIEKFRR